MENKVPGAQLRVWILTATIPTLLSVMGQNSWLTTLVAALVCATITSAVLSGKTKNFPRWLCVLEVVWLLFFLGGVAGFSAACWKNAETPMAIPLILLLLAAFAAQKGPLHCARAGVALAWLVLPILGIVALAGTTDIHVDWIRMNLEVPNGVLVGLLLLPCVEIFLPGETRKTRWVGILLCIVAVAGVLLTDSTMGTVTVHRARNAFYEFSKGITMFGVAERFEALIACALTAGWFVLFVLILSVIYKLSEKVFYPAGKWGVWGGAIIAAGLMCILPNDGWWMAIGALIFWGFLPVITQVIGCAKNIEKK